MALAGPQLALHRTDEEDGDFFDHLADDLGQRSERLLQNFEEEKEGEVTLEQALSKLCHRGDPTAAKTFVIGDQLWMQERVPNRELYFNPAVATITGLMEATREMSEADVENFVDEAVSGILEERGSKHSSFDMSNADANADVGNSCVAPLEEDDLQDRASIQGLSSNAPVDFDPYNYAAENAGPEPAMNLSASSQSLHSTLSPPASSQPVVKELQWSIFSEIYTPVDEPNALNEFLSDLDAGTEEFSNLNLRNQPALQVGPLGTSSNTNSLSQWKGQSENLADQNIANGPSHFGNDVGGSSQLHGNGGYGIHPQLNTHEAHPDSNSSVFSSYYGTSEQVQSEWSVKEGRIKKGFAADSALGNHNEGMHLLGDHGVLSEQKQETSLQQSQVLSSESSIQHNFLGDAQLGGSNGSVEAHQEIYSSYQQVYSTPSWESMYPGWYFDYATNEWKQIEGLDFATYSTTSEHHVSGSTADTDIYSTSSAANATISQLSVDQGVGAMSSHSVFNQGQNFMTGYHISGSTAGPDTYSINSAANATISQLSLDQDVGAMSSHLMFNQGQNLMTGYNETVDISGSVAGLTGSVLLTRKEESVPTSLGCLLEAEGMNLTAGYEQGNFDTAVQSQMQAPWEEQYPGWYYDYQAQQWRQLTAEAFEHSTSSNIEPSESQGDSSMKLDHDLNRNESVERVEESRTLCGTDVNNQSTSTLRLFSHAWGAPAVTTNFNDFQNGKTGDAKEALQVESEWSSYGVQSYSNVGTEYFKESEAPSNNFYNQHHHNQSHYFHKSVTQTKFSPDERPSHALVAFGFGGRVVTMKASSNSMPETVVLHDLNQLVQTAADSRQNDGVSYFSALNRGGIAGPLVGGGLATKEVLKWVDDRIASCETEDPQRTESLRVLWGVLRIACVHYGKVRPTHGSSNLKTLSEDGPELDLGKLLSTSCQSPQMQGATSTSAGLQQSTSSEPQLQSIALEMRKRLVEGKRIEALQLAQQGQLWGPALVLASHLGEKAYAETVLQMSQQQFVPGCPLRTLFLLLGGQTAELFNTLPVPFPVGATIPMKDSAGGMLGDWMGNLSIIAANPTNGDEQVITHLGDCLWKDHGEVAGAHTCYLVADTTFESFSENARLCLIGADHFKWQRTFATPMSIQRTELYEYAKALGNPQFILLPFQPYKLLYAYMLVEAGKVSEARRYCQAVSKALKNAGRSSESEFCRQAANALEERLRVHSQSGYNLNSATGKIVGKFIGTLDNTLHRIMGGLPPRQASEPSLNKNPRDWYSNEQKVSSSAKGREESMLDRSIQNENPGRFSNRQTEAPSRSVSEPNLSWSPKKKEHNATTTSQIDGVAPKENKGEVRRTGYLGRWFSTAVGFMKSNARKADLGDNNKFYYNKELKRWVEEGAEQTMQEMELLPPPISTGFESSSGNSFLDTKATTGTEGPHASIGSISSSSQIPPLPPSGNQYSARGRLNGVRARYVDTFNKKGTLPAKSIDAPPVPTSGWAMAPPPSQFFMPVQTASPTDNSTKASDEKLLDSIDKHASVGSITGFVDNNVAPAQCASGFVSAASQFSSPSLARDTAWLGAVPTSFAGDTSMNSMQSFCSPNDSSTESGINLDSCMHTAKFALPVPPVIEPQISSMGVENEFFNKSDEHTDSGLPNNVHEGILTDLQEVEL